jgi:hypothetical protein
VYWKTDSLVSNATNINCNPTFKAVSTSFLKEAFLLAVVWDMARIFHNLSEGKHLILLDFPNTLRVKVLKRRKHNSSHDLAFEKDSTIFTHLRFC